MRGLAFRLGIIGFIAIGAFVLRPFITGNANSLAVGDCFDVPTTPGDTVDDVQHHPCGDTHGAEVVFVGNYGPAADAYPTDDDVEAFVGTACIPAFGTYTGLDFSTALDYSLEWFWPTAGGWQDGNHKVICYVVRADGATLAESIKKQ